MEELSKGLLTRPQRLNDWALGGLTPLDFKFSNPDGDWSDYLPADEFQNRWSYDRMACVTYSILNCLEILYFYQTGTGKNFSDRFLAKASGTTRNGNYLDNVFDTIRKNGLIEEYLYPDDANSWDEYYKELPQTLFDKAREFLKDWEIYREWVRVDRKEDIYTALKSSPLQVTVRYSEGNGLLMPAGDHNHAVTLYNAVKDHHWEIFDHYTQTRKKYAWNYEFGSALKPTLLKKDNKLMNIENDTLLQLAEGVGGFGLYLNGKIIIDDTDKILASFIVRNNGDIKNKSRAVTLEQWLKFPHIDLKGNEI